MTLRFMFVRWLATLGAGRHRPARPARDPWCTTATRHARCRALVAASLRGSVSRPAA